MAKVGECWGPRLRRNGAVPAPEPSDSPKRRPGINGKSAGNRRFSHEIWAFPIYIYIFMFLPWNQCIDWGTEIYGKLLGMRPLRYDWHGSHESQLVAISCDFCDKTCDATKVGTMSSTKTFYKVLHYRTWGLPWPRCDFYLSNRNLIFDLFDGSKLGVTETWGSSEST